MKKKTLNKYTKELLKIVKKKADRKTPLSLSMLLFSEQNFNVELFSPALPIMVNISKNVCMTFIRPISAGCKTPAIIS